jgi:hypothetical protein
MAPGFSIRGYTESMRGKMTEELIRTFGESAKDLPSMICKKYRWWKNNLAVFKEAEVQEAPAGKLSIFRHSEAVPSILCNTLDRNKENQQNMRKLMKRKRTSRIEEEEATMVVEEAPSLAEVQGHEVEKSFTKEVFTL